MDRKHCRKRQHIILYITGLIFFFLASCAPLKESMEKGLCSQCSPHTFLYTLKSTRDFESALKRGHEILSRSPKTPPGDEALFDLGIIYAHPRNPEKDYRKSLDYFKRLLKEFPHSVYIEEARMWTGVLEDIEKATKVDIEIEKRKKEISK